MSGGDTQTSPIQLLVNYWEMRPQRVAARLDELLRLGVRHFATFVPWQAVESDISHTLPRFLQAASERKMSISLILTPELGLHYPNSGLPKDVIGRDGASALHSDGGQVPVLLPPNAFALPSLHSPEFVKRYTGYLSRMDGLLADTARAQPGLLERVTVVLTGSLWKYYRSAHASSRSAFGGTAGDYSPPAALAFRQRVEQFFSQREFTEPTPAAANRWKARSMEEVNRRWFQQQSEDVFRARTLQLSRKKAASAKLREIELHTPEADPGLGYSRFLQSVSGGGSDFARLSTMIDEAASRAAYSSAGGQGAGDGGLAAGFIHWTALGGFRDLSDPERQFLLLKSLLVMGGLGGGVLVDADEWFSLSAAFRGRAETLARAMAQGELRLRNRALYLAPHLWSSSGTLWDELHRRLGPGARLTASLDLAVREKESSLLIVDPSFILTRDAVTKLLAWAKNGRVLVLPRGPLYTEAARAELEKMAAETKRIEIDLGIPYRLHALGDGKIIVFDLPGSQSGTVSVLHGETLSAWQTFLTAVLSVAEVQGYCRVSDSRLSVIPLQLKGSGLGLFVLNGTRRQVTADLIFPGEVSVSDLAQALEARARAEAGAPASTPAEGPLPASRLPLEVPPCGILPLAVDGLGGLVNPDQLADERQAAARASDETRTSVLDATRTELPGYNGEGLWN
jgi:hypothetical protein